MGPSSDKLSGEGLSFSHREGENADSHGETYVFS